MYTATYLPLEWMSHLVLQATKTFLKLSHRSRPYIRFIRTNDCLPFAFGEPQPPPTPSVLRFTLGSELCYKR